MVTGDLPPNMNIGYKHRRWQAFLSVSCSGPEFDPILDEGDRFFRPRMAADIEHTTADVDFWESHMKEKDDQSGEEELHVRLREPTLSEFDAALTRIEEWLAGFRSSSEWDGGAFQLSFAGHGEEGEGSLSLADDVLTPTRFTERLAQIGKNISHPGRLRVSLVLDSCHSAAFMLRVLTACLHEYDEYLVPFNLLAACMSDEFAWEESSLGHGVFTYCMSIRQPTLSTISGEALQPDNSFGPSLAIASGALGCALLTAGAQNPVEFWNGAPQVEVAQRGVDIFLDKHYLSQEAIEARLKQLRDESVAVLKPMRHDMHVKGILSDREMRDSIRKTVSFIKNTHVTQHVDKRDDT
jgi:hypothetical protein